MIGLPAGTRIWIAADFTDMRCGFNGLAAIVESALQDNPFSGHVFVFRGRRGNVIKLLWSSGDGLCMFAKRLEHGRFVWPQATDGKVHLTPAQLSMLLEVQFGMEQVSSLRWNDCPVCGGTGVQFAWNTHQYLASQLEQELAHLAGGAPIGQAIIDAWLASFREQSPDKVGDEDMFGRRLQPDITAEFENRKMQAQSSTTVQDACMYIIENSGWGTMQEMVLKQATAADFDSTIRGMDVDLLPRFMRRMIEMRLQRATYEAHFGTAALRFVEACKAIANDPTSPRLATLVKRLFAKTSLVNELAVPEPAEPPVA